MTFDVSPLRDSSGMDDSSPSSVRTSFRLFSRPRTTEKSSTRTRRRRTDKTPRQTAQHQLTKDPTWEIRIRILQKNPALFQALRETLNDAPVYSHWAAGPHVVEFLGQLRMTELREDILAFQTSSSSTDRSGLLGYLQKRDKSMPQTSMRPVVTRISTSTVLFGGDHQDLSMPSLGGTEGSDDDDSSSGGGSVMSVRLEF